MEYPHLFGAFLSFFWFISCSKDSKCKSRPNLPRFTSIHLWWGVGPCSRTLICWNPSTPEIRMRLHVENMIYIYIHIFCKSKWCIFFSAHSKEFPPQALRLEFSRRTLWNDLMNHRFDKRDLLRRGNCKAYLFTPTKTFHSGTGDSKT